MLIWLISWCVQSCIIVFLSCVTDNRKLFTLVKIAPREINAGVGEKGFDQKDRVSFRYPRPRFQRMLHHARRASDFHQCGRLARAKFPVASRAPDAGGNPVLPHSLRIGFTTSMLTLCCHSRVHVFFPRRTTQRVHAKPFIPVPLAVFRNARLPGR